MSLLFCDGFDHYSTAEFASKWDIDVTASSSISTTTFRNGTGAFLLSNAADNVGKNLGGDHQTIIIGCAVRTNYTSGSTLMILATGAGTIQGYLQMDTGYIRYRHGSSQTTGTIICETTTEVLGTNIWGYLELKVYVHDTAGTVEIRLNGKTIASATGADTSNSATLGIGTIYFGAVAGNLSLVSTYFDDFYVCNNAGTTNNDFLGDIQVLTVYPTADGANSGWTPSTGIDHFALVDETPYNTTDYNHTETVSARDTYAIGNVSLNAGTVHAVVVNTVVTKDGGGTRKIKATVKSGVSYGLGAEHTLAAGSYLVKQGIFELDPNTSTAWTETTVNAMEAGADLTV